MALVVRAVKVLSIPAAKGKGFQRHEVMIHIDNSRWEGDGCSNTTSACALGEGGGVLTRAGSTTERILLDIAKASVADLLLHLCSRT